MSTTIPDVQYPNLMGAFLTPPTSLKFVNTRINAQNPNFTLTTDDRAETDVHLSQLSLGTVGSSFSDSSVASDGVMKKFFTRVKSAVGRFKSSATRKVKAFFRPRSSPK